MKTQRTKGLKSWVHRHLAVIITLILLVGLTTGALTWYTLTNQAYIQSTNEATARTLHEAEHLAEQTRERKEQEAILAKQAQEVAAKNAAEQAKTGSSVDSKACNAGTSHTNPASIDVVVNKKHCLQPLSYVPADLVASQGATLSAKAIDAFNRLYAAAATAGQPFYVTSSYRSYSNQIATYNRWVSISGAAGADTYSARPGYSEHQTGFAFDVAANGCTLDCFGKTSQYQWFQNNAADYGFIQRYYAGYEAITGYKAEEWHYRYVGVEVAKDMRAKGVKTLEQYWNIPGGDY